MMYSVFHVTLVCVTIYLAGDCNTTLALKEVGYIHIPAGGIEFVGNFSRESIWSDGIPSDGSPVTEEKYPILAICIVSYLWAGLDIIMAIVCILFTIIFRNKRLVHFQLDANACLFL